MKYLLNTEAMRLVEKDERGRVTKRRRYKKGDAVDASMIEESRLDALVESGTLVRSEDDLSEAVDAGGLPPTSGPFGAASSHQDGVTPAAGPVEPVQGEVPSEEDEAEQTGDPESGSVAANTLTPSNPESQIEPPAPQNGEDDEVEDVDKYSDMDYPTLQEAAKNRDLRYVGVSAEDLRASLREADKS